MKKFLLILTIPLLMGAGCSKKVVDCSQLSESECMATEGCRTLRGPSVCNGDVCTTDLAFKECYSAELDN